MQHFFMLVMALLSASTAFASGFAVKDQGAKSMSLANTFTGVSDDATAAWYNPAALVFQDGISITGGAQVVMPTVDYTRNGVAYSMDKKTHVIPFGYLSYNLEDSPLAFGLAVNAPFGLSTDWTNSGAGFDPTKGGITFSAIKMINVNPSVVYQINENLSFAAGVMYFDVTSVAFDNTVVRQHGVGTGWGGNAAIFYKGETFNAGLTYRSRVKVDVAGTATAIGALAAAGSTSVVSGVTFPDMVSGGVSFHSGEDLLVSAQVDWVNWKTFDQLTFTRGKALGSLPIRSTTPERWKAITSFSLGAEWLFQKDMHLRAGYAFDPRVVSAAEFSPRAVDNDKHFFTLGYGQDFSAGTLNLAYGYILVPKLNQTASTAVSNRNGTYKANIHILSADYSLHF